MQLKINVIWLSLAARGIFFGKASLLKTEANTNWQRIVKLSRKPQYYEKIMNLYSDGKTESPIAWCTFLVGNSSIDRRAFESTGGFDPGFTDWGFEHFEFAYRLKKQDFMFYSCPQAESFHLPHPRQSGFYQSMIHSSMKYFMQLHPKVPVNALERFFTRQNFHYRILKKVFVSIYLTIF